jgi:hypothetical protein
MDSRIYDKIDDIDARLGSIDKTLAVNTELLAQHIHRTHLIEEALKKRDEHFDSQLEEALQPIRAIKWIAQFSKQISAIAAGLVAASGLLYALLRFIPR